MMNYMNWLPVSFILKLALVGLVALVGATGGLYIGSLLIHDSQQVSAITTPENGPPIPDEYLLTFGPGDLFPFEDFRELDGTDGNFERLLSGRESVIVFASLGCDPCHDFFEQWKEIVEPELRTDIQIVVCVPDNKRDLTEFIENYAKNKKVIKVDGQHFFEYYNINIYPTIVGVDEYGLVTCIQYGHKPNINRDILKRFTNYKF